MPLLRLTEVVGTSIQDSFNVSQNRAYFGLGGDDTFSSSAGVWEVCIGGAGNDTYIIADNSAVTIADQGSSNNDKIVTRGMGFNRFSTFIATIDNKHLLAFDTMSKQQVVLIDWRNPENRIESMQLSDTTLTYDQLVNYVDSNHPLNYTWERTGIAGSYTTSEINEGIQYYKQRNSELVSSSYPASNTLFDTSYYLNKNPDVAAAGINPFQHYLNFGWKERRNPDPLFDTSYYLSKNPDVAAAGINPLEHYLNFGWRENRDPSSNFDASFYLDNNPDVKAAGINPLQHYLTNGINEGRNIQSVPNIPGIFT